MRLLMTDEKELKILEEIKSHLESGGVVEYGGFKVTKVNDYTGLVQMKDNKDLVIWAFPERMKLEYK